MRNDELFIVEKDFRETFDADGLDDRNWNQNKIQACHINTQ